MITIRPADTEFAPYYAGYVRRVAEGRLLETLMAQPAELRSLVAEYDEDQAALPTAPGKWSLKDLLNHVVDAERVFTSRLLWFAREPGSTLPGFDQNAWVPAAAGTRRSLTDLIDEFAAVRTATMALLRGLPAGAASQTGMASGHAVSVRALAWITAGHAQHHIDLLRERLAPRG